MKISYIDKYSWKCLLGKMARDICEYDRYATWMVGKRRNIVIFDELKNSDIIWLKEYVPFNFHYFSFDDVVVLKNAFKVLKSKGDSGFLDLSKTLYPSGKKYRGLRNRLNRIDKLDIEVLDYYRDINDVKIFIEQWRENYSDKYFRDNSGKNLYFYMNNFHNECINSFCYNGNELVALGTLSNRGRYSSYIVGKALYKKNPILSELIDFSLYEKANNLNIEYVMLGFSSNKSLLRYKEKFPGLNNHIEYSGKVK